MMLVGRRGGVVVVLIGVELVVGVGIAALLGVELVVGGVVGGVGVVVGVGGAVVRAARVVAVVLVLGVVLLFRSLVELGWLWYEALLLTTLIALVPLLCGLMVGLAMDFTEGSYHSNPISKRLHLWCRACVSLGFAPETIEKVVGKGMTKLLVEVEEKRRNLR